MLALEHLHANALLVVLLGGALAIVSLRAAVFLLHRSLVATDRKIISSLEREPARDRLTLDSTHASNTDACNTDTNATLARQSNELTPTYQDTPSAPDSKS